MKFFCLLETLCEKLKYYPRLANTAILFGVFGVFFFLSCFTPYVFDDIGYHYCYSVSRSFFDFSPDTTPKISSWDDILLSVKNAYFSWSGRSIAMFTVYAVFYCGKMFFNLLNGIMAAAVVFMICRHICGRKKIKPLLLLTISSLFFLCAPSPGLTLFWANGAIIYMWTAFFYLLLLYPYRMFLEYGNTVKSSYRMFYLIPAGLIGCSANENASITLVIVIIFVIIFAKWQKGQVPLWMFYGLFGAVVGAAVLFGAPGTMARIGYEGYHGISFLRNILTQTAHVFCSVPGIFAVMLLMLILWRRFIKSNQWQIIIFYLLLIAGTNYSMVFSPYTPGRSVFCTFIFILCGTGKIFLEQKIWQYSKNIIAGAVMIVCLVNVAFAWRDIYFTHRCCEARFAAMQTMQQNYKSNDWVFRPICGLNRYNALYKTDIMREDPEHFLNKHYAVEYGQRSISLAPMPVLPGMENNIFVGEK